MFLNFLIFLLLAASSAHASFLCHPFNGQTGIGFAFVCDPHGNCKSKASKHQNCVNLSGGPYTAAYSESSSYDCKIFSELNCGGDVTYVDGIGQNPLRFEAKSFRCPYKCIES